MFDPDSASETASIAQRVRHPPLVAATFLFRFSLPCQQVDETWPGKELQLPEACRIIRPAVLDGQGQYADVRLGWNPRGLAASVSVQGKKLMPRFSPIPGESDGLYLWVATRDVQGIHRANRFCHCFGCYPRSGPATTFDPMMQLVPIPRAMAEPATFDYRMLKIRGESREDGYVLRVWIPAECLTGYDPAEHPRLAFFYFVRDSGIGWQTLALTPEYPIQSDPSLWCELELKRAK